MHLTPERLDRAERWLLRRGSIAIVLGRVTPRLLIATVIVCGVFKVVPLAFSAEPCAGRFLYILMYTLLGYFLDPTVLDVVAAVHLPVGVLGSLVPLILLLAWIARAPRPRSGPHYRGQCGGSAPPRRDARLPAGWPHWSPH